jgi:hypothetical protein
VELTAVDCRSDQLWKWYGLATFPHLPVVGRESFCSAVQTLPATEPARTEGGEILFVFTVSDCMVTMLYIQYPDAGL